LAVDGQFGQVLGALEGGQAAVGAHVHGSPV
jgi:hypothetical protein